jgi:hypothetical protein
MTPTEEVIDNEVTETAGSVPTSSGSPSLVYVFPLTKTFTPPSSCLASTYTEGIDFITNPAAAIRGLDPSCYPQNFYEIATGPNETPVAPYYSPGFCPAGYATVRQTNNTDVADTTATCCPS